MVNLNAMLQAVLNAEGSLQAAEKDVAEAQERRQMAAEALAREQGAFDAAVAAARALARPSQTACVDTGAQILQEHLAAARAAEARAIPAAVADEARVPPSPSGEPEAAPPCEECGQPAPAGHVCRRMEGAPGPIPVTSPANKMPPPGFTTGSSAFSGAMPPLGYAPEDGDDREENTGD